MTNTKRFRNMCCRRSFKCLALVVIVCLIVAIILYSIWNSEEQDFYLEHHTHFDVFDSKLNGGIITVTGRSYESKFGHVKVYLCSASHVVRLDESSVSWSNLYWQPAVMDDPNNKLFIVSAYYDMRLRRVYGKDKHCFVRLLTMLEGSYLSDNKFYCQMWLGKNYSKPVVVDAEFQEIWFKEWRQENYFGSSYNEYKPYLVSCILPKKFSSLNASPAFVSITLKPCVNATNIFKIPNPITAEVIRPTSKHKFAICVKPLDFDQDLSLLLIQWLEINFILGADHIDIYTYRVHPNVLKVLNYYQNSGKNVRIISATLPGKQPNFPFQRSLFLKRNLWQKRRNELIPYNDCLYRNMYSYDYVIPLDIDEILVPKMHRNWTELFEFLHTSEHIDKMNYYASYSVHNAYFLESFYNSNETNDKSSELYFLKHLYRSANYSEANKSVKSFVRTDKTLTVFNHYALEAVLPGVGKSTVLPVELIQMNHYRKTCPATMTSECKNNFLKYKVFDDILMKYKNELEQRTNNALKDINLN